jgi:hypothetical protein
MWYISIKRILFSVKEVVRGRGSIPLWIGPKLTLIVHKEWRSEYSIIGRSQWLHYTSSRSTAELVQSAMAPEVEKDGHVC